MKENVIERNLKETVLQNLDLNLELEELEKELNIFENDAHDKELGFVFSKGGGSRPRNMPF